MATLHLGGRPWDEEEMPEVCMRCGAPAAVHKNKQFSWFPGWTYILILVNLLVFAIVAMVLTKRRRVDIPLCEAHRNHWLWRQVIVFGTFALLLFLGIGAFAANVDHRPGDSDLSGLLCVGTLVGLVLWLIVVAVAQTTAIRPTEITDRSITLVGVSQEFLRAYEEKQDVVGRIDDLARERWDDARRPRPRPRPAGEIDRVQEPPEDEPRRSPPDTFQEG